MIIKRYTVSATKTREDKTETKRLSDEEGRARRKTVETFLARVRVYTDARKSPFETLRAVTLDNGRPLLVTRNRQGNVTNQKAADALADLVAQGYVEEIKSKAAATQADSVTEYETAFHAMLDARVAIVLSNGRTELGIDTAKGYKHTLKRFLNSTRANDHKRWRDVPVTDWTVEHFVTWFKDIASGFSFSWGNQMQFVVGYFCTFLREEGVSVPSLNDTENKAGRTAKSFVPKEVKKAVTAWDHETCLRILDCARTWKNRYGYFAGMYLPVALAVWLGLRIKEIFWLRWDQIDLANNRLILHPSGVKCDDPNTPFLPLPSALVTALKSVPASVRNGEYAADEGWIVWPDAPRNHGKGFHKRPKQLDRIIKAAKAERLSGDGWHRFRRSLVTNLLAIGTPEKDVRAISRHTSNAFDRYEAAAAKEAARQRGLKGIEALGS